MKPKNSPPPSLAAANQDLDMENYFNILQENDYSGSFNRTATWVRQRSFTQADARISWYENMRLFLVNSKLRIAYLVLSLIFLVGACNYPVDVTEPVATVLRWEVKAQDKAALNAVKTLPWLKQGQLMVKEINTNGQTVLEYTCTLPAADKQEIQTYRHNLEQIGGVHNLSLLPLTKKTSRPLYAAALENILKIEMDATDISDADLKQSIQSQLAQKGITDVNIQIARDDNGLRRITTRLPQTPGQNFGFDLTLKDGKQHTRIKEQVKFKEGHALPDFKSMTDAEIKAYIIKDHPALALTPDDIKLDRQNGDIQISIDKDGNKLKLRVR